MRKEITERTLYKFDELSDEAREKTIERLYDINVDHEWWNFTYEDAKNVGITITGFDLGRAQECTGDVSDTEATAHAIIANHGEACDTYKTAKAYLAERDAIIEAAPVDEDGEYVDEDALDSELDEAGEEFVRDILWNYWTMLNNEHDYLTSEEAIVGAIEANDYEFTEDGELA